MRPSSVMFKTVALKKYSSRTSFTEIVLSLYYWVFPLRL